MTNIDTTFLKRRLKQLSQVEENAMRLTEQVAREAEGNKALNEELKKIMGERQ